MGYCTQSIAMRPSIFAACRSWKMRYGMYQGAKL